MTPQDLAPPRASETGSRPSDPDLGLIAAPSEIFDAGAVRATLDVQLQGETDAGVIRRVTVTVLSAAQIAGRTAIAEAFAAKPLAARRVTRAYAYLTDGLVKNALAVARDRLHPNPTPTDAECMAVLAVGGYGRGEMAPFSDVDLLFLMPYKQTAWAESVIESTLYMLWDLHLKVGHASRNIRDCLSLGRSDMTIRTTLLETRLLDGDTGLAEQLQSQVRTNLFAGSEAAFTEAKLAERDQRHRKQGGQRYMVEPNVKEAKGGLRDLQTLYWIAKYIHGVDTVRALVDLGVFSQAEFATFDAAERFLWCVRCHLHLVANRASDQLTFDAQVAVAERMGYEDRGGMRGVEHFMQDYFRHATRVGELTRIFLTALEASQAKKEPAILSLIRGRAARRKRLKDGFAVRQNRLTVEDEETFFTDKLNILRVFEEGLRTGYLIHPDLMRAVNARLHLIDGAMQRDPEAARIFWSMLLKHANPERALRRMNELGALGCYIPEFAPIVAMMQFNMYHSYTVDEHTIQVISTLAQIERGELIEELPIASRILDNGVNRKVLYAACLIHDLGKGQPEDHSILGAKLARQICPRLGLKPAETETVEWLVRYHLLMSDTAQKRDISDPRTVRDFAKAVKTKERLDLLTVLTVCDIRGVGPNTWNNWKATLLRGLYRATATAMDTGLEDLNREKLESEAKKALRDAQLDWPKAAIRTELARHYGPYWQGLDLATHVTFSELLRGLDGDEIGVDTREDPDRDATRVCFALADHPGIFARLAGALSLVGANIVDARTYTSKDGFATAAFWVQDSDGNPYDHARLPRLRAMIDRTLKGEVVASRAFEDKPMIRKRERDFDVPTHITFDNDGSEIYTIIEVDTRDRPGLLYDLTKTLAAANVYISSAVIATYGAQVVDTFYVKDTFGLKLYSPARQKTLANKLHDAIDRAAERAGA
ncbi:MAG: [protein-PII] uridylyltransferase [Pseudomonadota bacterium]